MSYRLPNIYHEGLGRFGQGPPWLFSSWKFVDLASSLRWLVLNISLRWFHFALNLKAWYILKRGSSFVSSSGLIHMSNRPCFLLLWLPRRISPDPVVMVSPRSLTDGEIVSGRVKALVLPFPCVSAFQLLYSFQTAVDYTRICKEPFSLCEAL